MWLITKIGFFSIVEKSEDRDTDTLTIRARVRSDLEALRSFYIPTLGAIVEYAGSDYRYRARANKEDIGAAMVKIISDVKYSNFKDEIANRQGKVRAALYGEVWNVLYSMQSQSGNL